MSTPIDDSWLVPTSFGADGSLRLRARPPDGAWIAEAQDLIILTWTCGWRDRLFHGRPSPVTEARMETLEKRLTTLTEANGSARLMMVTTEGLKRTWYFYVTHAAKLTTLIERAINEGAGGSLSVQAVMDPGWQRWQAMAALANDSRPRVTTTPDATATNTSEPIKDKDGHASNP